MTPLPPKEKFPTRTQGLAIGLGVLSLIVIVSLVASRAHIDRGPVSGATVTAEKGTFAPSPDRLLQLAKQHIESLEYDDAVDKLNAIPSDAPEYKEAQKLLPSVQKKQKEQTEQRLLTARRSFAQEAEQHMLQEGFDMYVRVSGPKDTTITFRYILMSRPTVYQIINDSAFMNRLRSLGFKNAVFTDGYYSRWNEVL